MASTHKKLTDKFLDKGITPPTKPGQQDEYWDTLLPGFGVRVGTSGRKTFNIMCRVHGRLKRGSIGTYPQIKLEKARNLARTKFEEAAAGKDPFAYKTLPDGGILTFEKLAKDYVDLYAKKKKRTWKEDESKLERNFSRWNTRPAASITQEDVHERLLHIEKHSGPVAANRNRSLILKLFKWARQQRLIPANPVPDPSELPKHDESQRDRILSDDEIKKFWKGCDGLGYPFGHLLRVALICGRRRGTVALMKWQDVNLETGEWSIPGADEKTGRPDMTYLPELALEIIRDVKKNYRIEDSKYVFTTNGKNPVSGFTNAKKALDKRCKIEEAWVIHDLRRTCMSGLTRVGVTEEIADRVLGHVIQGIARVYNRYSYAQEKREALDRWAAYLEGLVSGKKAATVTRIGGAA